MMHQQLRELLSWADRRVPRADSEYLLATLTGRQRHELYMEHQHDQHQSTRAPEQRAQERRSARAQACALGSLRWCTGSAAVHSDDWRTGPIDSLRERFQALVERASSGVPVEYLVREAAFLDFRLYVDERVMIPRSETEELVVRLLDFSSSRLGLSRSGLRQARPRILDVGTGSGAIAIALARAIRGARILASDVSAGALEVARLNIERMGLGRRIELIWSDLFGALRARDSLRFDVIVSNPPYVRSDILATLDRSVRDSEPGIALDGGPDGLRVIRPLLEQAPDFLAQGGILALEIDPSISSAVRDLAPSAVIEQDWCGLDRYLLMSGTSDGSDKPDVSQVATCALA